VASTPKYIVDANTLIEAANVYYTFRRVPGFWNWMAEQCSKGTIRSASMVKDEIEFPAELVEWVDEREVEGFFVDVSSPEIQKEFQKVAKWVMAQNFGPEHKAKFLNGADPWIIAAAKVLNCKVVTQEKSGGANTKKVKIPDVCAAVRVECINTFAMTDELNASF
jgi:hypothetical protein